MTATATTNVAQSATLQPLVRQFAAEYERLVAEERQDVCRLPTRFGRRPTSEGEKAFDGERGPSDGSTISHIEFSPPDLAVKRVPWPIYLPPLYTPACVTTLFAPPYLLGSEERAEQAIDGSSGLVSYSAGHADDGSIDVMALAYGLDSSATLYDSLYRGRTTNGWVMAGVHSVSPTATQTELIVKTQVEASGVSAIYYEEKAIAWMQLSARIDVVRFSSPSVAVAGTTELHVHTSVLSTGSASRDIDISKGLSATISISPGDNLAVFLSADARVIAADGRAIVAILNASSDGAFTQGGAVRFPFVELRQC